MAGRGARSRRVAAPGRRALRRRPTAADRPRKRRGLPRADGGVLPAGRPCRRAERLGPLPRHAAPALRRSAVGGHPAAGRHDPGGRPVRSAGPSRRVGPHAWRHAAAARHGAAPAPPGGPVSGTSGPDGRLANRPGPVCGGRVGRGQEQAAGRLGHGHWPDGAGHRPARRCGAALRLDQPAVDGGHRALWSAAGHGRCPASRPLAAAPGRPDRPGRRSGAQRLRAHPVPAGPGSPVG